MPHPLLFACYQQDGDTLFQADIVRPFFTELATMGYHLVTEAEVANTFGAWWHTIRHTPENLKPEKKPFVAEVFQPRLSPAFSEALDTYLAKESGRLKLRAYNVEHVLEFTLELCPCMPDDNDVYAEVNTRHL